MAKWILVDGYNLAFRCYYAIPNLRRADGFPTNALHGWIRSLWKLIEKEEPDSLVVVFDFGEDPEKKAALPQYKDHRQETPQDLRDQIPLIKEVTALLGLETMEVHEIEADDVIATLAERLCHEGHDVSIVSADKDLAQCVKEGIKLLLPPASSKGKADWRILDSMGVEERFGVRPSQIADYLALAGDAADNIPGVPGVGPKTAAKWLAAYGDLPGVIAHADSLTPVRFREFVRDNVDDLFLYRKLTALNYSVDLPEFQKHYLKLDALCAFLEKMEMPRLLADARERYRQDELNFGA